MLHLFKHLFSVWAWKMAWRDSRPVRWRLLLFSSSILFGVAALVTIGSLRQNLHDAVGSQAKSLLGADLLIASRQPFAQPTQTMFSDITAKGAQQASELSFTTMLKVGDKGTPKLVTMRGFDASFPFYGKIVTNPAEAWDTAQSTPGVIVESAFLKRMNSQVGDMATLGDQQLPILGVLVQAPPSASGFSALSPTVITSLETLRQTQLAGSKSLAFHRSYFKLPEGLTSESIVQSHSKLFAEQRLTQTTAKKRSSNVEKAINRLYTFFNLIGLSALFLGGIGVAGAIHLHISERLKSVATLRCLGCSSARAFAVYLAQSIAMGVTGSIAGILTGSGFILLLGLLVDNLPPGMLPFAIDITPAWGEIAKSGAVGLTICISFALLPLLSVRRVSPLAALRRDDSTHQKSMRDPLRWFVILGLFTFAFGLTWMDSQDQSNGWKISLGYIAFLSLSLLFLTSTGKLLRWLTKKLARPSWPFVIRQGITSLYRPNNQTGLFMVSIGLGVFLIFTLLLMQNILLQWLDPARMDNKPNVFLVDVPPEQNQTVEKIMADNQVKLLGHAPIIQMRLTQIKGRPVTELTGERADGSKPIPRWILRREFRSTYRDQLTETEKLKAGKWIGSTQGLSENDAIPVSFEEKMASDLGIKIGDEVTVSIEGFGESRKLRVASLREVNWQSMNLNFFIVFPTGTLEPYVSFNVIAAHSPNDETTAQLQQEIFKKLPYVNSIDLSLIMKTVQSVLNTAGQTIQVMAMFTVITGGIVLIASILAGRRVRIRESVLLRTLGASRGQISRILAVEYALLAILATLAGSMLAVTASILLGNLVFDGEPYHIPWGLLAAGITGVVAITVSIGMLLSRGIASQPPLQILRSEGAH